MTFEQFKTKLTEQLENKAVSLRRLQPRLPTSFGRIEIGPYNVEYSARITERKTIKYTVTAYSYSKDEPIFTGQYIAD